jgi:hypothetical protein
MQIDSVNRAVLVTFTVLSLLAAGCSLLSWHQHQQVEQAQAQRVNLGVLSYRVERGASSMAELARAYAATGHPRYALDYQADLRDGRGSERALSDLRVLPLMPAELTALDAVYDGVEQVRAVSDLVFAAVTTDDNGDQLPAEDDHFTITPRPEALSLAYGEGMEEATHQVKSALRSFRQQVDERLILTARVAEDRETLLGLVMAIVWVVSALMILFVVIFYYRRKVVEPIKLLTSELAEADAVSATALSNLDLQNEVGRMIRVVSRAKETIAQMELLRRIRTATAEITLAAHQATSLPGIAQTLSVHLSQRLNHAVVVVHLRPGRKSPLQLYGGRLRTNDEHSILAAMVRDRGQGSAAQPTDPGLVLECERSQKIIQVTGLPPSYLWLNSGTGKARPRCLTLAPIVFDRKTLGVVEIASVSPLQSQCVQLVKETCEGMALLLDRAIPHLEPLAGPAAEPLDEDKP